MPTRLRDLEIYPREAWPVRACPACHAGVEYVYGIFVLGCWTARCMDMDCATYTFVGPLDCIYCGESSTLKEHLIPQSRLGAVVVPGCYHCNNSKLAKMPFTEFRCPGHLSMVVKREAVRIKSNLEKAITKGAEWEYPQSVLLNVTLDIRWWDEWIQRFEQGGHNMPRDP